MALFYLAWCSRGLRRRQLVLGIARQLSLAWPGVGSAWIVTAGVLLCVLAVKLLGCVLRVCFVAWARMARLPFMLLVYLAYRACTVRVGALCAFGVLGALGACGVVGATRVLCEIGSIGVAVALA